MTGGVGILLLWMFLCVLEPFGSLRLCQISVNIVVHFFLFGGHMCLKRGLTLQLTPTLHSCSPHLSVSCGGDH